MPNISKTDFVLYRTCPKNAWFKINKSEVYNKSPLSEFEHHLLETGNEVELVARKLFPDGVLVEGRGPSALAKTEELMSKKTHVIFQPLFIHDGFLAAVDILEYNAQDNDYHIYEIKASSEVKEDVHLADLAFQVNLLQRTGLPVEYASLIHLNSEYRRKGALNYSALFTSEDLSEQVREMMPEIEASMNEAKAYLNSEKEPVGYCTCVYKGRSNHCTTFRHSNGDIPAYGVHDLSRIGASKKKLAELIDMGVFDIKDIPEDFQLSDVQRNQVNAHLFDKVIVNAEEIRSQLGALQYPLYFLDYETFPAAIPRFDGFGPYMQIVFQYSVDVVNEPNEKPVHHEFIYTGQGDPSEELVKSLREHIGDTGSVIVWNKTFECGRNSELAERLPQWAKFMNDVNERTYDLMDIFKGQHYVHKDFRGSASIKKVLPVMAPELSYKELEIGEGGTAMNAWNEMVTGNLKPEEKEKIKKDLLTYCGLDTYAMYAIWQALRKVI